MEAKDTLLLIPQGSNSHQTELCRRCAFRSAQAEHSFKVGQKEVVEELRLRGDMSMNFPFANIRKEAWQAFEESKGIDESRT